MRRFCELVEDAFPPLLPTTVFRERLGDLFDVLAAPTSGVLRPAGLADRYRCPAPGGDGCPRRVVDNSDGTYDAVCGMDSPGCADLRGLTRADLDLHRFDCDAFLDALCRAGSLDPRHDGVMIPPYTFQVGDLVDGHRPTTRVFFAARPAHPGFVSAMGWIRSTASNALVLLPTLRMLGTDVETHYNSAVRFGALDRMLLVEDGRLVLRLPNSPLADHVSEGPAPSYPEHCAMVHASGEPEGRLITRAEYDRLVAQKDAYDLLADGLDASRKARRRLANGNFKSVGLSPSEFTMLLRYITRSAAGGGACRPWRTGVSSQSPVAARETFKRMRRKVDVKTDSRQYRFFKMHTRFEGGDAEYEFSPSDGASYCVIAPPPLRPSS